MESDEIIPIVIRFHDGQAIKTDEPYVAGEYVDYKRVIICQFEDNIAAMYHLPINNGIIHEIEDLLETAIRSDMEGYTGKNQESADRFADYMVHKLNNGGIRQYYIN
jgi:hypothetical protein